jgi:hypothetical protein
MGSGAATGAIVGGVAGLAGGIINSINTKRQLTQFRRRQRAAIQEARDFTDQRVDDLIGDDSLFAQGRDFLSETFENTADSPLAQDFVSQLRAGQASRGTLHGGAAVTAEAAGLSAFSQQLRMQLLPQILAFSREPETLRQSILGFEAPLRIASKTGALLPGMTAPQMSPSIAGSALAGLAQGAAGGASIGASFDTSAQLKANRDLASTERLALEQLRLNQQLGVPQGDVLSESFGSIAEDPFGSAAVRRLQQFGSR